MTTAESTAASLNMYYRKSVAHCVDTKPRGTKQLASSVVMGDNSAGSNLAWSKFNCLNYILLNADCQTPFNPHEMDIERKLFALAI